MHDPQTLAFSIKSPFKDKHGYRNSIIDIWHCDPENFTFPDSTQKQGGRRDDSCGWYAPMYHESERIAIEKLAKEQYSQIYARQITEKEGKDYAYVCNQPETMYEVIYWIWRSIKAFGKKGWQYGNKRNFLSSGELEFIMELSSNPVDNFKHRPIKSENDFIEMFFSIWTEYRRFHRKWYQHPRWHIHHWKINFPGLRDINRKWFQKCDICGIRGFRNTDGKRTAIAYGNWSGDKTWCPCCNADKEKTGRVPVR